LHDNGYAASERKDLLFSHDETLLDFANVGLCQFYVTKCDSASIGVSGRLLRMG